MNENEFISLLKKGNPTAFKELVEQYGDIVFNTSIGILQNNEDAEDVSQEVFVEVFRSVNDFQGDSKLSTWLYRIAVNKSLEFIRKKKRKKRFAFIQSLFGSDGGISPTLDKPHFYHPGIELENKERAAILFKAIDKLPDNQKTAFILHKTEGLSYQEVSAVMKVSVPAVESLLHRAKQNLRKILGDYYEKNEK